MNYTIQGKKSGTKNLAEPTDQIASAANTRSPHRIRRRVGSLVERLFDTLMDPFRQDRAVLGLLTSYALIWTLYGIVQKSSQDIKTDTGELYVWSHQIALGYWKHPPLGVYVVKAWTMVFPAEDWSFYLLGMTNAAVTLWIVWRLSASYLTQQKRVIGLALLMLVPFYNFRPLTYDHNTLLMPFWALTTLYFLRSFEMQRTKDAALAGFFAGLAMLGKYWTVDLLAGLALAALLDSRRNAYFISRAPLVTTCAGALVLLPHLVWQHYNHYPSFAYALDTHPADGFTPGLISAVRYFVGMLLHVVLPIIITVVSVHLSKAALIDTVAPEEKRRRLVCLAFWAPQILPVLLALSGKFSFVALWAAPALTLFPIVLLGSPHIQFSKSASVRILGVSIAFPLLALFAAPFVSAAAFAGPPTEYSHSRLLSEATQRIWQNETEKPLQLVIGPRGPAIGIAFYSSDHPEVNPRNTADGWNGAFPPIKSDPEEIKRKGLVIVCEGDKLVCLRVANFVIPFVSSPRLHEIILARHFLGRVGSPATYLVIAIPPSL